MADAGRGEAGLLGTTSVRPLDRRDREAAGLRKLLVHGYAEVDDRKVWDALADLDHLRDFAVAVSRAIAR